MFRKLLTTVSLAMVAFCTSAYANPARLVHKTLDCATCHTGQEKQVTPPMSQTCIKCHGSMESIKLPANAFKKDAHRSPHYADLVECTVCHAEHKQSQSLCSDCHIIK